MSGDNPIFPIAHIIIPFAMGAEPALSSYSTKSNQYMRAVEQAVARK